VDSCADREELDFLRFSGENSLSEKKAVAAFLSGEVGGVEVAGLERAALAVVVMGRGRGGESQLDALRRGTSRSLEIFEEKFEEWIELVALDEFGRGEKTVGGGETDAVARGKITERSLSADEGMDGGVAVWA